MASPTKLPKLDSGDDDDIFELFCKSSAMGDLKEGKDYLAKEREGLCLLKLIYCNGDRPVPFSHACCDVTRSVKAGLNSLFFYESVFGPGFRLLDEYITNKPGKAPKDKAERLILKRLLTFLMHIDDADKALYQTEKASETEWTVRLTHHLLSPLAADQMYSIDKQSKLHGKGRETCPCCREELKGKFTDTSIGNPDVWHGFLDVILGTKENQEVPVHVADIQDVNDDDDDDDDDDKSDSTDEPDSPVGNVSSVEIKLSSMQYKFYCQMISETIVFSFLQKQFLEKDSNTLIPTIGVTRDEVYIFMYDHEHDMLVESTAMKLRKQAKLKSTRLKLAVPTVVALWLAINYKYLCSGTPESMRTTGFNAGFPKLVPSVYKVYENEVKHCCGKGRPDHDFTGLYPSEFPWLSWRR